MSWAHVRGQEESDYAEMEARSLRSKQDGRKQLRRRVTCR